MKKLVILFLLTSVSLFAQTTNPLVLTRPSIKIVHPSENTGDSLKLIVGNDIKIESDTTLWFVAKDTLYFYDEGNLRFKIDLTDVPANNDALVYNLTTKVASWQAASGIETDPTVEDSLESNAYDSLLINASKIKYSPVNDRLTTSGDIIVQDTLEVNYITATDYPTLDNVKIVGDLDLTKDASIRGLLATTDIQANDDVIAKDRIYADFWSPDDSSSLNLLTNLTNSAKITAAALITSSGDITSADDFIGGDDLTIPDRTDLGTGDATDSLVVKGTVRIVDGTQGASKVLTSDANGAASWQTSTGGDSTRIADDDDDTKVQVEESADEDKIRFDTGGTERMVIHNDSLVINPGDGNYDVHIRADTTTGIYVDASSGYVGIGTNNPTVKFVVKDDLPKIVLFPTRSGLVAWNLTTLGGGGFSFSKQGEAGQGVTFQSRYQNNTIIVYGGGIINETGEAGADFRVESDNNTHQVFSDASVDKLGFNTTTLDSGFNVNLSADFRSNVNIDGKLDVTGAVDPAALTFSRQTFKSIREMSKGFKKDQKVALCWIRNQLMLYNIKEDRFYTVPLISVKE